MENIAILGCVVLSFAGVLGWLFYSLKKYSEASSVDKAVPVTDIGEINGSVEESVVQYVPGQESLAVSEEIVARSEEGISVLAEALKDENAADQVLKLQEEVRAARETAVLQARGAIDVINKLEGENETLHRDMEKAREGREFVDDQGLVPHLKAENAALITQMQADRAEDQKQRDVFYGEIESLKRDNAALKAAQAISSEKGPAEALKGDMETLHQLRAKLEARIEELEEAVRVQEQKNSFLQYELTKSRAQAVGVERVCDNARRQFEGMVRETRGAQQDNDVLRKQSNILEQGLSDFKRLNSELLKREKFTQFELENNRTQLKDLEHIYQVFRMRLENAGVNVDAPAIKS